jgi:hypothetical protein
MLHEIPPAPAIPPEIPSPVCSPSPERLCHWVAFCVARDFALDTAALYAATRGAPRTAFARQVAMYLAHTGFQLSHSRLSRIFGRDRTTVAHACRVVEEGRDDIWLDCRLEALEMFCRAGWAALQQSFPEIAR